MTFNKKIKKKQTYTYHKTGLEQSILINGVRGRAQKLPKNGVMNGYFGNFVLLQGR